MSTAYYPRTDGQSERTNQWPEQYLRFWVHKWQDNWVPLLPLAEFVHNNWIHEGTRKSPFFLMMGYSPCADWIDKPSPIPQLTKRLEQFREAQCHAQKLMIKVQQLWVKNKDMPKYWVGDQVWLEGKHLRTQQPTHKLAARHHGLFTIQKVLSPITYRLTLPHQWCIHPVFHIDLLTPYQETPMHGVNYQCPLPDLVDGEEEYEIKKVIDL